MAAAERIREVEGVLGDPGAATDGELIGALQAVERAQAELALQVARVTAECDRRMLWSADGSRSPAAWLAKTCQTRRAEAAARVREARNLRHMPATVDAAEAGDLSASKVSLLARARRERLAAEFDRVETMLVDEARRLRCDDLARLLQRWESVVKDRLDDPTDAGAEPEERPSEIHLSQSLSGRWTGTLDLTLEDGAILSQGITDRTTELFHTGATTADGTAFTPAQRRGRAFVDLWIKGMGAGPDDRPAHPLLMVVVDAEQLTDAGRACDVDPLGGSCDPPVDLRNVDPPTEAPPGAHAVGPPAEVDRAIPAPGPRSVGPPAEVHGSDPPPGQGTVSPPDVGSADSPTALRLADQLVPVRTGPPPRSALQPDESAPDESAAGSRSVDSQARPPLIPVGDPTTTLTAGQDTRSASDARTPIGRSPSGDAFGGDETSRDGLRLVRSEIVGAGPVSKDTIARLVCDGAIRRVLVDPDGEPLDVGRASRLATPAQRAALIVRDGGCVFPDCDATYGWCQAHHLLPWDELGPTDIDNLALICRYHHHLVHEGKWTLARDGLVWIATSPTGRQVAA